MNKYTSTRQPLASAVWIPESTSTDPSVDAERENILSGISSARLDNPISTQQEEVRSSNSAPSVQEGEKTKSPNQYWDIVKNWGSPVIGSLVACICISFNTPIWVALLLSVVSAIVTAALLHSPIFKQS